jgi:hypothetical protein
MRIPTGLLPDTKETFRVSAEEKRMLLESIAQADRGELVDSDELLRELDQGELSYETRFNASATSF